MRTKVLGLRLKLKEYSKIESLAVDNKTTISNYAKKILLKQIKG